MAIQDILNKYDKWPYKPFLFGMETMRVTQNYNGATSHLKHQNGTPKDYPIDLAGVDGGRSAFFCTVDMKVTAIRGKAQKSVSNTIWLVSTEKVLTPNGVNYVFMTITHWNDGDVQIGKLKVGSVVKAGTIICYEGTDSATANHLHVVYGFGSSDNWVANSKGAWVITGNTRKPEEVCYVDNDFTIIADNGGINFKAVPKEYPIEEKKIVGTPLNIIQILGTIVNARESFSTSAKSYGYIKPGNYSYKNKQNNEGYDWYEVEPNMWVAYSKDWAKLI